MNPGPDARASLRDRVAGWNHSAFIGVRAGAVALASLVLCALGHFALSHLPGAAPWSLTALVAGVALAALRRWKAPALFAATVGMVVAMSGLGQPWPLVALACLVVPLGAWLANAALTQLRFDARLQRASDIGALLLAVATAAAVPQALGLSVWVAASSVRDPLAVFFAGWCAMTLGGTAAAVAALALDRSLLAALALPGMRRDTWIGVGCIAAMALALLLAPIGSWFGAGTVAVLVLPLVVCTVLVLRGQFALGACALLLAGLLEASTLPSAAMLGVWGTAALALLLAAQASAVEWSSRTQRWEWALDGSRMGVADWHLQRDDSFASGAWRALTGHAGKSWSPEAWLAQVHPGDRDALAGAISALTAGDAGRAEVELRLPSLGRRGPAVGATPGSGSTDWRWAEATLMVIERDASAHPLRLLATLADTQDKRDALERQRMSAALFQHLHEGLLITDPEMRALDVNPAYCQILGVPREEVLGTVPTPLRPAPADPVARQQRAAMWTALADTGTWRGELMERRRSGEVCTLQATISAVHGPGAGGEPVLRYHVLVISDISEQQAQRERLQRQAHFDELTRLPNRARLTHLLDEAMRAADRDGYLLAVCYLDLDRFKPVNDRYGHAAGDRLLSELAGRLRSALRSREQWADSAARLGGDEFVLLLRAGTLEEARLAVERVLRVVAQPYVIDPAEEPVQVTASMGATVYPLDRSDADTLLRHADHAMYSAKQSGRNGYLFFDPEHRRRTEQRVLAIGRIQEALDQQEFVLYYQPKVDMKNGRVLGFEALLRWEHPQQGLVAPLSFLPLIENTGLSSRVGDWVISRALEHLNNWRRDGLRFSVSVNVSARHLQEPDFAQRLAELLARHDKGENAEPLAPWLELEMLETAAHADIEATSALVARCQALGVKFALDDFGTGYSTLSYLKRLPVDVLKIDRSFVHHMLDDPQDRAIVEGVIGLARTFGCTAVAEGVESPAQARMLLELGCEVGQGTGIAAPMPPSQVATWVREYRGMFALGAAAGATPQSGARTGAS